ncbi:MAG: heavy metal-binding domain-containing protein [Limisphaerales bacterium]
MKFKLDVIAVLIMTFGLSAPIIAQTNAPSANRPVLYYTCPMHPSLKSDKPGSCPICGMALEPVYADNTTNHPAARGAGLAPPENSRPTPYPLKTCIVSGETLGEMGDPIVFVYTNNGANQEIKFCCPMCKPKFLQNPEKYMKLIRKAEAKK